MLRNGDFYARKSCKNGLLTFCRVSEATILEFCAMVKVGDLEVKSLGFEDKRTWRRKIVEHTNGRGLRYC